MAMRRNLLRERLNAGKPTVGTHILSAWPTLVELIGHSKQYDYVEFTAEYAPFFAVLFLYLGSRNPPHWQLWCMAGATACRLILMVSLLAWPTMSKPNPARAIGALGTYGFGVALCVALLIGR